MDSLRRRLDHLKEQGLYRSLRTVTSTQGAEIILNGRRVINFSGNNTLGVASRPALVHAVRAGLDRYGVGACASRLISGNTAAHERLEKELASFTNRKRALLFSSGYQANIGAIPALTGPEDLILSDALNHASLIDGIRLSHAECKVYPHNDLQTLKKLLLDAPEARRILVITESLFSMEGDRAPLAQIAALKKVRPFLLYVDEAHSLGVIGPGGRGLCTEVGCSQEADVLLGTLGKAFGVCGAFIAAGETIVETLINCARSLLYTTAPPPLLAEAALAALWEVDRGDLQRDRLRKNAAVLRNLIKNFLGEAPPGLDHIVPVRVPGAARVMAACTVLLENGIFCQGIRPPTVPAGECRLRFSVCADHTPEHLNRAARELEAVLTAMKE